MGWETIDAAGTSARQYVTGAETPGTPGVVLFHAWWELDGDVLAYADRLEGAGFAVVAPDLVAGKVVTTVEQAEQLSEGADEALASAVTLAAVDGLAVRLGPDARLGTIGFSFGAPWSIWCAAERDQTHRRAPRGGRRRAVACRHQRLGRSAARAPKAQWRVAGHRETDGVYRDPRRLGRVCTRAFAGHGSRSNQ